MQNTTQLEHARARISRTVRRLRRSRQWTQGELAKKLGLSQSRLSEIERGGGSFTAEQLLLILRLFNADLQDFDPTPATDGSLQNALVRHGARHLRTVPDAAISSEYASAAKAVAAVLLNPNSERFVTALAPVLLQHCDDISLPSLQITLSHAGRPNRLGWLVENVAEAVDSLVEDRQLGLDWKQRARRLHVVAQEFLANLRPQLDNPKAPTRDPLDRGIRTPRTLEKTWRQGSPISTRWHSVSALQVADFTDALRRACASD